MVSQLSVALWLQYRSWVDARVAVVQCQARQQLALLVHIRASGCMYYIQWLAADSQVGSRQLGRD